MQVNKIKFTVKQLDRVIFEKASVLFQMVFLLSEFRAGRISEDELLVKDNEFSVKFVAIEYLEKAIKEKTQEIRKNIHQLHLRKTQLQLLEHKEFFEKKVKPKPV